MTPTQFYFLAKKHSLKSSHWWRTSRQHLRVSQSRFRGSKFKFLCENQEFSALDQLLRGPQIRREVLQYLFPGLEYLPEILITAAIASFLTDVYNWNQKDVAILDTLGTAFTPSAAAVSQSLPQRVDLPDSTPSVPAGNLSFWEKQT
ncbi:hypothetical protein PGT21_029811 [Puccinia graminis f. sp. tritici]|uniref:Uncharacterized protein n=1 Tax=Puccinia graminis f. sp. tritici TaxID=56615 RepID=A0A5B0NTT5_PUCGR|nr:hypothetical protein PGT21_029811 [Puccinia graminis f. sp. tritici]